MIHDPSRRILHFITASIGVWGGTAIDFYGPYVDFYGPYVHFREWFNIVTVQVPGTVYINK